MTTGSRSPSSSGRIITLLLKKAVSSRVKRFQQPSSYRCNADAQATQPCKLHRDEVPCNNTFPTRHSFEGARRLDEQSFRRSLSSEMWHLVAGASEPSATSIYRTSATLLTDHTVSHLNNHHYEFLKSHKHQFQDCSKALGITVIVFFGVNAFPCTTGLPQGHNFVWHTIWINIVRRCRWWQRWKRIQTQICPLQIPFPCLLLLSITCIYTKCHNIAQYALRNKLLNRAK